MEKKKKQGFPVGGGRRKRTGFYHREKVFWGWKVLGGPRRARKRGQKGERGPLVVKKGCDRHPGGENGKKGKKLGTKK